MASNTEYTDAEELDFWIDNVGENYYPFNTKLDLIILIWKYDN